MIVGQYFYFLIFIPLIAASLTLLFKNSKSLPSLITIVLSLGYFLFSTFLVVTDQYNYEVVAGSWPAGVGIKLKIDTVSSMIISIVGAIYFAGALYSQQGITAEKSKSYFFLYNTLFLGLSGAFLTSDLFNLFVWFEITLMSSYVLVVLDAEFHRLKSGLRYIVLNFISGLLFLISVGLIYNFTKTLDFSILNQRLNVLYSHDPALVRSLAICLFGAFAIKSAFFPFFFWLPESYPKLSPALSGVLAGLLTKLGLYAMLRVFSFVFPADIIFFWMVLILSLITLLVGVWGAVIQGYLRNILSYHIISQVGFIGVGVSFALHPNDEIRALGISASLFYILHHIVVKTNLFFVSGLIKAKYKTELIKDLGGIIRYSPLLAILFVIPAGSLIGIPPLSGFWAKLSLFKISIGHHFLWVALPMIIGSFFTLYSMVKIWSGVYWGESSSHLKQDSISLRPILACVFLCLLTLFMSLNPEWVLEISNKASL